jgi:hypothetical protein
MRFIPLLAVLILGVALIWGSTATAQQCHVAQPQVLVQPVYAQPLQLVVPAVQYQQFQLAVVAQPVYVQQVQQVQVQKVQVQRVVHSKLCNRK